MIIPIEYNIETRNFALSKESSQAFKNVAWMIGVPLAVKVGGTVLKVLADNYGTKVRDQLVQQKSNRLNKMFDKYAREGKETKDDPETVERYKKELHKLISDTIHLAKLDKKDNNTIKIKLEGYQKRNEDLWDDQKVDSNSIFKTHIAPFLAVLRMIVIREVHILPGSSIGADRRNFELVFDTIHSNPDDVSRSNFRNTIFKHSWPAHNFNVSKIGATEANELITSTVNFLAEHPKYLAIRL